MNMKEIRRKIGQDAQLFGVREVRLVGGRGDNQRLVEMENGTGLQLELLPDRGLDPYRLRYKGVNLSYITNVASPAAAFADGTDHSFFTHFNAGLMTTCGLQNVGPANDFNGKHKTQHGRFSTIPADQVCAETVDVDGIPTMRVWGTVREATFFGLTLSCKRVVEMKYGENKITIRDIVKNEGYSREELMLLYHCNFGYPLLDKNTHLILPPTLVTPRDEEAKKGVDEYMLFHEPVHAYAEQCFYLDCEEDKDGMVYAALVNPDIELAVKVGFKKAELPFMTEWKQMGEQEYVVGIEPGNCHVEGSAAEEARGTLTWLEPGEEREFGITFEILEGKDALAL